MDNVVFAFELSPQFDTLRPVIPELFKTEMAEALKAYDKYVVCVEKTPEDFNASLNSLLEKAIKAYESRGPHLRHGIALDRHVTVILSQTDNARPLCGIYFNLASPYQRPAAGKSPRPAGEEFKRKTAKD